METQTAHDEFYIGAPSEDGGGFTKELITAGEHQAVCCQIHNVGHQMYNNEISRSPKAIIMWEVDQKMTGGKMAGKPMVISESYQMYMGEGKLRTALEGWRGNRPFTDAEVAAFSLGSIRYAPCTLLIVHVKKKDGNLKAKIAGILPPKGAGWQPTYLEVPEWIQKEKAMQVAPPPKPAKVDPKGPATHDVLGGKLPF